MMGRTSNHMLFVVIVNGRDVLASRDPMVSVLHWTLEMHLAVMALRLVMVRLKAPALMAVLSSC